MSLASGEGAVAGSASSGGLVSVIITVAERPEPLNELYAEFAGALTERGFEHEFIFVGEPWADAVLDPLQSLVEKGAPIKVIRSGQAVGEAHLVRAGLPYCNGDVVVLLPCYRRISAESVPELIGHLKGNVDMVTGRRWKRKATWLKRLQADVFRFMMTRLVGGDFRDVSSGVTATRKDVLEKISLYGDFYRFLPIFARREGFHVIEVDVQQHAIDRAPILYGPGTYIRRFTDLIGLYFLVRFNEKPLRFFGFLGGVSSVAGAILLIALGFQRIRGVGIADRPLLVLAVLLISMGVQAIALGLIGEIVVHLGAPRRIRYRLLDSAHSEDKNDNSAGSV